MRIHRSVLLLLVAGASASAAPPKAAVATPGLGFKLPVEFKPTCANLAKADKPPANLTVKDFVGCLTDDSKAKLDRSYRHKVKRAGVAGAPATLDALVAAHGTKLVANVRPRELAFGAAPTKPFVIDRKTDGTTVKSASTTAKPAFGFDPTTCDMSCLSKTTDVVNDTRTVGFGAAATGPEASGSGRLLDQVFPGTYPNHDQHTLKNQELVAAGCGPVSAVNMLEWWNIPVYEGSKHLTSFDSRTEYIAKRMETLDGINYTDDDDLLSFMESYPKEQFEAKRIPGYPGYHYMEGDPEAIKVMLSYIARGYPVIALYATGGTSLHWALITGYQNGKLAIANATDLSLSDFFAQWDSWDSMHWYAKWAAELVVTEDTFFAYTGWHSTGELQPPAFAARGSSNPGYTQGSSTYRFRYCIGGSGDLGDAESSRVSGWSNEPNGSYCLYIGGDTAVKLTASSGGTVSSKKGEKISLTVTGNAALTSFIKENPGAHCSFYGKSGSTWKDLVHAKCTDAKALEHAFTNDGQYSEIMFTLHARDLAHVIWKVKVN